MNDVDIDAFVQWFQSNGGLVDTKVMGITEFPGSGRGGLALCDIPEGHTLFTLPRKITLSTRTSPLPALFGLDAWHKYKLNKGWLGLILCMMWEDAWAHSELDATDEGQDKVPTKWGRYMQSLPATFDTPMFWNSEELKELQGTSVVDKIGREDAERAYHEQLVPAIKTSSTLFPPSHYGKWYTLDAYHRAGSRILSRSFAVRRWTGGHEGKENKDHDAEVEGVDAEVFHQNISNESSMHIDDAHFPPSLFDAANEELDSDSDDEEADPSDVAMVPMADMLNARWGSENAKLFHEPFVLRMVSTKDIKKGEQIFNTYGDPPNSDLLRRYGHVDLVRLHPSSDSTMGNLEDVEMLDGDRNVDIVSHFGNPSDVVEVRADSVVHVVQKSGMGSKIMDVDARIEWWLDQGEDDAILLGIPEPESNFHSALPLALISLTRLLIMSETDFENARSKGKLPKGKLKKDDVEENRQLLEILDELLNQREAMYIGGSVQDDERLLSLPESLTDRKRHAVIVRLGEKRILRNARQVIGTMLAELDASRGAARGDKDDARRDNKGGNGGNETGSGRKRVVNWLGDGNISKRARK